MHAQLSARAPYLVILLIYDVSVCDRSRWNIHRRLRRMPRWQYKGNEITFRRSWKLSRCYSRGYQKNLARGWWYPLQMYYTKFNLCDLVQTSNQGATPTKGVVTSISNVQVPSLEQIPTAIYWLGNVLMVVIRAQSLTDCKIKSGRIPGWLPKSRHFTGILQRQNFRWTKISPSPATFVLQKYLVE